MLNYGVLYVGVNHGGSNPEGWSPIADQLVLIIIVPHALTSCHRFGACARSSSAVAITHSLWDNAPLTYTHTHTHSRTRYATVVVVGHSNCGGCNAAFAAPPAPLVPPPSHDHLGAFLAPLIQLRHKLPPGATADDLVKENVRSSVKNVVDSAVSVYTVLRQCPGSEMLILALH